MGFTVVHEPSYALVGAFAAEAAKKQRQIELAREWADLFLRKRQLDLQSRQMNLDAAYRAAQLEMSRQQALMDAWLQQQRLAADWMAKEAAMAHEMELARMREAAATRRMERGLEHERGMALIRHEGDLELERLRAENATKLEELRSRDRMLALESEFLSSAMTDASRTMTALSTLELNDEGRVKLGELQNEYQKIIEDRTLTPRAKAEALRIWMAKAVELNQPMYRVRVNLEDRFKERVVEINGLLYQLQPDGTFSLLGPRTPNRSIIGPDGQPQKFYSPEEEQYFYITPDGKIEWLGLPKSKFFESIFSKLDTLDALTTQDKLAKIQDIWKAVRPPPPGGQAGAAAPMAAPEAAPAAPKGPTIEGIEIPANSEPHEKLTAIGGPFVYSQLQLHKNLEESGSDFRAFLKKHLPTEYAMYVDIEDSVSPAGYKSYRLVPRHLVRGTVTGEQFSKVYKGARTVKVIGFDNNVEMSNSIKAQLDDAVNRKDPIALALLESSVADSLWRIDKILAPGRPTAEVAADLYNLGWITRDAYNRAVATNHLDLIEARTARNLLLGHLHNIRKAMKELK
ncbi:MAG: hypothetical protein QW761_02630 [Candidatus Aenigmatarchaeota archaeon]